MSRLWNDVVAVLVEITPGGIVTLAVALLGLTTVVAMLWYFWPLRLRSGGSAGAGGDGAARVRRRWRLHRPRWKWRWRWRLRWRWRRRRRTGSAEVDRPLADDELPDVPAEVLALTADQLAAAGRYAEAVRERLRAIVRDLVERDVIEHRPGWTVTELARAASTSLPPAAPALRGASDVFSGIWYGQLPATVDDDRAMREYAVGVGQAFATHRVST